MQHVVRDEGRRRSGLAGAMPEALAVILARPPPLAARDRIGGAVPAAATTPHLSARNHNAGQLQYMADLINTVRRNHGLGVFYWGPEGMWGDGMWRPDGTAAPSIYVLDHLDELKARPASRIPPAGEARRSPP